MPAAEFRIAPPGTTMTWRRLDGYKTERGRIGEVDDMRVHFTWEGQARQTYLFCIGCDSPDVEFDVNAYKALFPLAVGKSVEFPRRIEQWHWVNHIEVVDTEVLELPLGTVNTFVVQSETRGLDNPFHARNRIWFAPDVGWNVQFQYQDSRGTSYAWQAIEFQAPMAH